MLARVADDYHLLGFRSGMVSWEEGLLFLCSQRVTNNTGETEAFGHALGRTLFLGAEEGDMLFVADNKYATQATQALQSCSVNVRLAHAVRRIWRRLAARRRHMRRIACASRTLVEHLCKACDA